MSQTFNFFLKNRALLVILIFGIILRLVSINQSFWLDEATSGIVVRDLSFSQIINNFLISDFHPPFYYLALKVWSIFFGTSELALRSMSIVAGILTIYIVYLISKSLEVKTRLLAPLLLATSGLHIYYSQEARMYSLVCFFVSLTVLFFIKLINNQNKFKYWIGFSLTLLLSIATHYLAILMLPTFWLIGFFNKKEKSWWRNFLTAHTPLIFGLFFWYPILSKQLLGGLGVNDSSPLWASVLGQTSVKEIVLVFVKFILGRISFENNYIYGIVTIFVFGITGYVLYKALKKYKTNSLIILWFFVPIITGLIIGIFVPVFSYFRFLFILPAFYLLISFGISESRYSRILVSVFLFINVCSSLYYLLNIKFHREDWKGLVNFIEEKRVSESQVLFVANSQMEGYKYYSGSAKIQGPESLDSKSKELWLIRYVKEIFDPEDNLKNKVELVGFEKTGEYDFNGIPVLKYENRN